jgi:eukaryotic-like serine/threonine-protein kinase
MADDSELEIGQGSTHSVDGTPEDVAARSDEVSASEETAPNDGAAPLGFVELRSSESDDKTVISGSDGLPPPMLRAGSPQEIASLLSGQRLGHFNLDQFIGGGGMGAVFRAHDQQLDRTVAIKVLSKGHGEEEVVRRFRIEAQSAARLDHENIARVFYVGEDCGWDFIVFEYIDGANLRDLVLQKGASSIQEALQYGLQIAAALQHASERDVVHRDIKPSNVLVTASGQVKLVDMGLARFHDVQKEGDLTESGVTLGTFDYISPEQARDPRNTDVRSDLYSLGCTLYFVLTGQPPFPDGNFFQKLLKHQNERHPDPRLLRPDLDDDFVAVLDKLLAKQPARRYQTPAELIAALLSVAHKLGIEVASPRVTASIKSLERRTRWQAHLAWMLPLSIMVLGVWAVDAYLRSTATASTFDPHPKNLAKAPRNSEEIEAKSNATEISTSSPEKTKPRVGPYRIDLSPRQPIGPRVVSPNEKFGDLSKIGERAFLQNRSSKIGLPFGSPVVPLSTAANSARVEPLAGILVVTDDADLIDLGPDLGFYPSLREACLALAEKSGIHTIELQSDEATIDSTMQIQASQLTIRSTSPSGATLLRVASPFDAFSSRNAAIVQLGGVVRWEGIQFEWDLPTSMSRITTFMELRDTLRTSFKNCVFTARAGDAMMGAQDAATVLRVETTVEGGMMTPEAMTGNPSDTIIELSDCLVRGDATMLAAAPAASLYLRSSDSLFASSKRLVELRGAARRPIAGAKAKIELQRSTIQTLEGLVRTTTTHDELYTIPTHLDMRETFVSALPNVPLVENYRQVPSSRGFESNPLEVDGEGNTYFGATVLWALTSGSGRTDNSFPIKDLVIPWYRESTPGFAPAPLAPQLGNWIPTESATPELFLSPTEAMRRGGFAPGRLPTPID